VLCASNITFATWLESLYMLCPITSTRYVTVVDNVPDRRLALQEVAALYDGGWKQGCMRQHPERWPLLSHVRWASGHAPHGVAFPSMHTVSQPI
jgi:hypothetical protein